MFSQASVCTRGGCVVQRGFGTEGYGCGIEGGVWYRGGVFLGVVWPDTLPPQPHQRDGHCRSRYASYWNAFLLEMKQEKYYAELQVAMLNSEKCFPKNLQFLL